MMTNKLFPLALLGTIAAFSAACGGGGNSNTSSAPSATTTSTNQAAKTAPAATTSNANTSHSTDDSIPASVRAALPDAQTFTKQHKDIPAGTLSEIEQATGARVTDRDHHAYLAFSTQGGGRKQVGAATLVKAGGQEFVVAYDSRGGMPVIREVRAGADAKLPAAFLDQFKGKDHDAAITFGNDIKAAGGAEEALAKQVTAAIKGDVLAMQALYGSAHTH